MVILPRENTYRWQKRFVAVVIVLLFILPIALSISWYAFEWPGFPTHEELTKEKFTERMSLLKYMISLGLSIIGATWFLAGRSPQTVLSNNTDYRLLSWSWTLIGIAILSAFLQVYLTYKDYFTWAGEDHEVGRSSFVRACYGAVTHALYLTCYVADSCFFVGGVLLVFAVIGVLHRDSAPKSG